MLKTRVIPSLLLKDGGLVKTVKFKHPKYVGDPINAVRIFNEKEVDELVFLDISATLEGRRPHIKILAEIATECFMPLAYGGGIRDLETVTEILGVGVEKVVINSFAAECPQFISQVADKVGSSSVVVSIDVKKTILGKYEVCTRSGTLNRHVDPVQYAVELERMGAGEIFLNSMDRDGTMSGYDLALIRRVTDAVTVPVIASGGAGQLTDFSRAVAEGGASAVSAGSMFVFHGQHRAVLISYPTMKELEGVLR